MGKITYRVWDYLVGWGKIEIKRRDESQRRAGRIQGWGFSEMKQWDEKWDLKCVTGKRVTERARKAWERFGGTYPCTFSPLFCCVFLCPFRCLALTLMLSFLPLSSPVFFFSGGCCCRVILSPTVFFPFSSGFFIIPLFYVLYSVFGVTVTSSEAKGDVAELRAVRVTAAQRRELSEVRKIVPHDFSWKPLL